MTNEIKISMLGGFSMEYRDNAISDNDNRSKKVWTLLEYLITFHSREITHDMLIQLLWHGTQNDVDSENALKTILHRTRATLDLLGYKDKRLLLHRRGTYAWNNDAEFTLDIDEFRERCVAAADLSRPQKDRMADYYRALELYKGRFLPKNSEDDWVIPVAEYYHTLYIQSVHSLLVLLFEEQQYDEIIRLCRQATAIDPYDEPVHYYLIRSLFLTGQQKEAISQYQHVMQLFYDKFGINPSDDLTALYQEIVREEQSPAADLNSIKEKLREQNAKKGAYFCDFSVFQNLYRIEARGAARSGLSVYLCLVTLTGQESKNSNAHMAATMAKMADAIRQSLRTGDVFSRYSVNQYIIMLSSTSYENCVKIGERIIKAFLGARPKPTITASYRLDELEPMLFENEVKDANMQERPLGK